MNTKGNSNGRESRSWGAGGGGWGGVALHTEQRRLDPDPSRLASWRGVCVTILSQMMFVASLDVHWGCLQSLICFPVTPGLDCVPTTYRKWTMLTSDGFQVIHQVLHFVLFFCFGPPASEASHWTTLKPRYPKDGTPPPKR